ncbi:MAG: hypothetical protein HZA88_20440 [Verrucomicrobia bacterium]|nr:hypothetical protein [Verrucomicrobiota bacterium]
MRRQSVWRHAKCLGLMATLCCWMATGCATVDKPGSDNLAQVRIEGHSDVQVDDALRDVFMEKNYKVRFDTFVPGRDSYQMEFFRKGSPMNRLAYGSWLNPAAVEERIKVSVSRSSGGWLITLDASMISDKNDSFEEEHRLTGMTHDTYQQLLDAVKARLP